MRLQSNFKSMNFFFLIPLILSIGLLSSISFFDLIQEAKGAHGGYAYSPMIDIQSPPYDTNGRDINTYPMVAKYGESLPVVVEFKDRQGNFYQDVNYDIVVTQFGLVILDEKGVYDQDGKNTHQTLPLHKDASREVPVNIRVNFLGFGTNEPFTFGETIFTGPIGDFEQVQVIPEFGTVAVMILGISIISIIAVTARSKVIPRL